MRMSERILTKELKKRGYIQRGKSYMRVVGDGVFQHILLGFKERLHTSSPGHSLTHRYEPRILIYLKSMYALYDGSYIGIDCTNGFSLTVPELLDKQGAPFMGASGELERMLNEGLDVLDRITTQHQIIECLEPLMIVKYEEPRYSTQLYDMYLYQEEFYKARMAIATEFAENYFANMSNLKRHPDLFSEKMHRFLAHAEEYWEQYELTWPVQYDESKNRLQNNFAVNSNRLKALGIPLTEQGTKECSE